MPSGGSVMRAVSFFGAAAFCVTGSGAPGAEGAEGAAAGFNGTVGRAPREGGFGGGVAPPRGLEGGTPKLPGGRGGAEGGANGLPGPPLGGGGAALAPPTLGSLLVSFFGAIPAGGIGVSAGLPGTLIRTVSRFTAGCSAFGGRVIRIVSFFVTSSESEGAGGLSSGIRGVGWVVYLTRQKMCQYVCPPLRLRSLDSSPIAANAHGNKHSRPTANFLLLEIFAAS